MRSPVCAAHLRCRVDDGDSRDIWNHFRYTVPRPGPLQVPGATTPLFKNTSFLISAVSQVDVKNFDEVYVNVAKKLGDDKEERTRLRLENFKRRTNNLQRKADKSKHYKLYNVAANFCT